MCQNPDRAESELAEFIEHVQVSMFLNSWVHIANIRSVASHKRLRKLAQENASQPGSSQDCSICLGPVAVSQPLLDLYQC